MVGLVATHREPFTPLVSALLHEARILADEADKISDLIENIYRLTEYAIDEKLYFQCVSCCSCSFGPRI
jgi:hypothetical protein